MIMNETDHAVRIVAADIVREMVYSQQPVEDFWPIDTEKSFLESFPQAASADSHWIDRIVHLLGHLQVPSPNESALKAQGAIMMLTIPQTSESAQRFNYQIQQIHIPGQDFDDPCLH